MSIHKVVLTADIIIQLTSGEIVLVRRKNEPYKDMWALPGGILDEGETIETAAVREAKEETGLDVKLTGIAGVYSDPHRDPRGHYVSITYAALVTGGKPEAADDATEIKLAKPADAGKLAFDHNKILSDFMQQKVKK